jgi:hypothetical protein
VVNQQTHTEHTRHKHDHGDGITCAKSEAKTGSKLKRQRFFRANNLMAKTCKDRNQRRKNTKRKVTGDDVWNGENFCESTNRRPHGQRPEIMKTPLLLCPATKKETSNLPAQANEQNTLFRKFHHTFEIQIKQSKIQTRAAAAAPVTVAAYTISMKPVARKTPAR